MLSFSKYTHLPTLSSILFLQSYYFFTELRESVLNRLAHRKICQFN